MRYIPALLSVLLFFVFSFQHGYSQKISPSVTMRPGAINGIVIERNGKTLAVYGDPGNEIKKAEMVLFTHFRRDVVWAGRTLVERGSHADRSS